MSAPKSAQTDIKPALAVAQKRTIMLHADQHGVRAASEQFGVPANTIYSWRKRDRKRHEIVPAGNLVHGGETERQITHRARRVHQALLAAAPWLAEDKYMPAVSLYLRSAARSELLDEYINRVSAKCGIEAVPSRTLEQATAASNRAFKQAEALGLTPAGHSKLKVLVAGAVSAEETIQSIADRGRAAQRARAEANDVSA